MASDLIVGPLDEEAWEYYAAVCKQHGMELPASYCGDSSEYPMLSAMNLASIVLFINYAAGLEGFHGPDAITKTTFRSLPWWMESAWLPLDLDPPIVEGGTFIGSSIRLLDELMRIRKMSALDLAVRPADYADMREDYSKWFNTPHETMSEDDTLRWIWSALHEGAEISIEQQVPILLVP